MALLDGDAAAALAQFREATDLDPAMADAWLGRVAAGDDSLSALQELYACGARLHRETNRIGAHLSAHIKAGPYLAITVTEASHAGLALASALVDDKQFGCTVSLGAASFNATVMSAQALYEGADRNLEEAKKAGRNKVVGQ